MNRGGVSSHLLDASVQFIDLWLEEVFQLGPLGFQSRSQEAVLDGEQLWVEVNGLHLHQVGGRDADVKVFGYKIQTEQKVCVVYKFKLVLNVKDIYL